ncbi:MAG: radical SAM protein [Candidatus Heimdallarchaeaceae archaeon]
MTEIIREYIKQNQDDYVKEIREKLFSDGMKIGWGLTYKCNMKCAFCYSWKLRDHERYNWEFKEVEKLILQNSNLIKDINWGTGENVFLSWFPEIVELVNDNEISQSITTNGSIAAMPQKAQDKTLSNIDEIDVSIDYSSPSAHNKNRGNEKAFDLAIDTLKLAREYGIKATIVSVLFKENAKAENFLEIAKIAKKYDAYLRINLLVPTVQNLYTKMADPLTIVKIFLELIENMSIVSISDGFIANFLKLYETNLEKYQSWLSYPGYSYRILPKGGITPNTYLISDEWIIKDVKRENEAISINEILSSKQVMNYLETMYSENSTYNNTLQNIFGHGSYERKALNGGIDPYNDFQIFNQDGSRNYNNYVNEITKLQKEIEDGYGVPKFSTAETIHSTYLATNIFKPCD